MENEFFKIMSIRKDPNGENYMFHLTQEINLIAVWMSTYHCDGREYTLIRSFDNHQRDFAIINTVDTARGAFG